MSPKSSSCLEFHVQSALLGENKHTSVKFGTITLKAEVRDVALWEALITERFTQDRPFVVSTQEDFLLATLEAVRKENAQLSSELNKLEAQNAQLIQRLGDARAALRITRKKT